MLSWAATVRALARSREAIAVTVESSARSMAGMTFLTPMLAVERTPQRTFFMRTGYRLRVTGYTRTLLEDGSSHCLQEFLWREVAMLRDVVVDQRGASISHPFTRHMNLRTSQRHGLAAN